MLFVCHACSDPGDLHDGIIDRKLDKMAAKVDTLDPVTSVARGREWYPFQASKVVFLMPGGIDATRCHGDWVWWVWRGQCLLSCW